VPGVVEISTSPKSSYFFVGVSELQFDTLEWCPDDIEIAWRLAREHRGHGYATEAASAWLDHG